jgi:peptidoglycan hydrolase CwlO-like protein
MKSTALFLILLSFICYVSSQQVFDQVKSLLSNFRGDIQKEEVDANARCVREDKWMVNQINLAIAKLAHRTKDVNDLKGHIKWLENEIKETNTAIKSRQDRIAANLRLLEQFKRERCENNLLFVKSLREHIEGIEVMSLLRSDIVDYFKKKSKKSLAFIEKFAEFEHLLDEENKLVFSQLKTKLAKMPNHVSMHAKADVYTTTRARTAGQQGVGHVDNARGELKRLSTPGFEQLGLFLTKLEKKVLFMIDSLILHLKNSRDALTRNEIKASEDFAIFQKNMFKENAFLADKIKQLQAHLVDLKVQLNKANQQLVRREKLRREAEVQLANLRRMRKEKKAYCTREHARRVGELTNVGSAEQIFQNVLNKLSLRVKLRTQSNTEGKGYRKGEVYTKHVRAAAGGVETGYKARLGERSEVAY